MDTQQRPGLYVYLVNQVNKLKKGMVGYDRDATCNVFAQFGAEGNRNIVSDGCTCQLR